MEPKDYNVQCPNGHVQRASRGELVSLFGEKLARELDDGSRLDAPMIDFSECYDCEIDTARRDRTNALLLDPV